MTSLPNLSKQFRPPNRLDGVSFRSVPVTVVNREPFKRTVPQDVFHGRVRLFREASGRDLGEAEDRHGNLIITKHHDHENNPIFTWGPGASRDDVSILVQALLNEMGYGIEERAALTTVMLDELHSQVTEHVWDLPAGATFAKLELVREGLLSADQFELELVPQRDAIKSKTASPSLGWEIGLEPCG